MTRMTLPAILTLVAALPAEAEQFVVRMDAPYEGASDGLLRALRIVEIDSFRLDGRYYIVLDAPGAAYVQSYVYVAQRAAFEVGRLDADWTDPVMAQLTLQQRLGLLSPVDCDYCVG